MISELRITDPTRTCIDWWESVPWLKGRDTVEFKPGINILWGPNGSGKSTVMKAIARMLHAEQGGFTCPTDTSVNELFPFTSGHPTEWDGYTNGAVPIHDGQAIMHFDPMHAIGLSCGGAAFDWDFSGGIRAAMFKGSSGQTTLTRFNQILEALVTRKWPDTKFKAHGLPSKAKECPPKRSGYDHKSQSERRAWMVTDTIQGTLPVGPRTILLDEPDRSLDLPYQWSLWARLAQEKNIQIIAASHSLVALGIPGAHYIELGDGDYLAKSERVLDLIVERAVLQMKGIDNRTKVDILGAMLTKPSPPPPRDPRVDPQEGDLVRIPWKGKYQLRVVVERFKTADDRDRVRWRDGDAGKGGTVMGINGWQRLTKGAAIIRTGVPK